MVLEAKIEELEGEVKTLKGKLETKQKQAASTSWTRGSLLAFCKSSTCSVQFLKTIMVRKRGIGEVLGPDLSQAS